MNKKLFIFVLFGALLLAGAGCWTGNQNDNANANTNVNANEPLIGGQKDAHGCLIAAGYSWCETKQKCLRIWEEGCYETEEAALAKIFSSEHKETIARTHVRINALQNNFAAGGISFGEVAGEGGAFLARLADGAWAIDYEGNGSVDCPKIKNLGYPQDVLTGFCDATVLSEEEARTIAEKSCIKGGEALDAGSYNENTATWWFDANLNATREGCNPACVVDEETKKAEINWRCTGLVVPE